jgi:HAT1-interacting factor 1
MQESGEDDPDILFSYGKALFQVAQKNSQVLGGAPANDPTFGIASLRELTCVDPKEILASAAAAGGDLKPSAAISFSGDAEEEGEDDEEEEQDVEKEDDFKIAWEVLETAKVLYEDLLETKKGKAVIGKGSEEDIAVERKIADVCDLLGEVSIENGTLPSPPHLPSQFKLM